MGKITVFNNVSLDGCFAGPNNEIDWFKISKDDEYAAVTEKMVRSGSTLIFGQITYELMKNYWPTSEALKNDPIVAEVMNNSPKIVFSNSMTSPEEGPRWKKITLFNKIDREEILKLKEKAVKDFTILGSGTIVQQFTNLGLIDEYLLVVHPIILGAGKSMFKDVKRTNLKFIDSRSFKNGLVWLRYQPADL